MNHIEYLVILVFTLAIYCLIASKIILGHRSASFGPQNSQKYGICDCILVMTNPSHASHLHFLA